MPSALAFRDVAKAYGRKLALDGVSLDVDRGTAFGLVGMNGAGKTTLLKCLLDFSRPDRGDIAIFGTSSRESAARARLAFLPERFVPPYFLTGRDFLRYMLALQYLPYTEDAARSMLAALDLDPLALDLPVRAYSKGMTQKLGLCACFLAGRDALVLDEPTSGLDPKARALLKRELRRQHALGRTLFLTSHALADVEELCSRMAVLHQGRLRFTGTPAAFRERYDAPDIETAYLACIGETAPLAGTVLAQ